ncbi:MAG TPA: bifunctional glycosyltransferase family 2 protein/CDP-glycerol:glycerophosphate glycerophosphotransferase [Micromonosporaceae bacterium]
MGSVLSVVVPVYNVAPYLHECLTSIANQTFRDIEVVMVDDGSTDDSAQIAADFAAKDPRFRLVSQPNKGLGAARNTGVTHATGGYLMFVDSDDTLPGYALELLVSSLEQTGSDFATGQVYRLNSRGLRPSPLHRWIFAETRLRTHVTERRELLGDRTAWNKVFRRQFWDEHGLRFPEGVLYEDAPVIVPAHVLARSVDVLSVPIYYWREREGPDRSITQRREELRNFVDRFNGVDSVSRLLAEQKQARVKLWYDTSALRGDLMLYMRVLPDVDEEYQHTFMDLCNEFLDRAAPGAVEGLHTSTRLQWHLVHERMLPDLLTMILAIRMGPVPIVRRGLRRYHQLPYLDAGRPELPRELYRAGVPTPRTKLHEVTWVADKLHVRGHAFIQGAKVPRPWSAVRMLWVGQEGGGRVIRVFGRPSRCPDATADSNLDHCAYDWSGFDAAIDVRSLRGKDGTWADGVWSVSAGVVARGQKSRGVLSAGDEAGRLSLVPRYVEDDVRITPHLSGWKLQIRVERVVARALASRFTDDAIEIEGDLPGAVAPSSGSVQLSRAPGVTWRSYPARVDGRRFAVTVPLSDLRAALAPGTTAIVGAAGDRWFVEFVADNDPAQTRAVVVDESFVEARRTDGDRDLRVHRTVDGGLEVSALPAGPAITGARWVNGEEFELRGDVPPTFRGDLEVVLRLRGAREERAFPASMVDLRWSVRVNPVAVPTYAGTVQLRSGTWDVLARPAGGGSQANVELPLAGGTADDVPLTVVDAHREISLERTHLERLALRVRPDLEVEERGTFGQARLRDRRYPAMRRQPLHDAVLFNSFTGRQYSDSPRAIHEELVARGIPLDHLWVVRDGQVALPESASPVRLSGADWYDAFATCRYIVTNQHLPEWFRRREGQVVVQTWHGTPLKRIAHDIADVRFADLTYLSRLDEEVPNWSLLLSPNRFSTPILRSAFRFDGEILESGYPRNDVLCRDTSKVAKEVRERLALPADKKIVLYAPTWRDDEYYGPGRYKISLQLDVDRARRSLGADHVILVRAHPNVVDEIPQAGGGFVWDVSTYPDIADLLAAADILVTDYSSVMFDFASTGRPMLFFTYDLEHYRDRLRGFYVDFEAEAPGPLLATSEEVVDAIRDIDAVVDRYREAYRTFAARACDLDDGHATARVVDRMLELG